MSDPLAAAIARHHADPNALLQILRDAQAALGWLSPRARK